MINVLVSSLFGYLCYGSTAIIIVFNYSSAGTIFQILTSKDGPHAESVLNAYLCDTFMFPGKIVA